MVQPSPGAYTLEMWERLPRDGNRYELLAGELVVTPSPGLPHQTVQVRLASMLHVYAEHHHIGCVWAGMDLFAGPHTVLVPDIAVGLAKDLRGVRSWKELRGLALAVEIISPSSARDDRGRKREVYLDRGCEYWIVDLEARSIERWHPGDTRPSIERDVLRWHPVASAPPLSIDVAALFTDLVEPVD